MNNSLRKLPILAALALILAAVVLGSQVVGAQQDSDDQHDDGSATVRVIARLAADGRVEFGLRASDGALFPRGRFFPVTVSHHNWLQSTPITIPEGKVVRIIARRNPDTRLEFGVRINDPREDFLPRARFFPGNARVGNWLASTPVVLPSTEPAAEESAPPAEPDQPAPSQPEPPEPPEPENDGDDDSNSESPEDASGVERISGGHRDGLIVNRGIVGDPNAPVLIVEYSDPF